MKSLLLILMLLGFSAVWAADEPAEQMVDDPDEVVFSFDDEESDETAEVNEMEEPPAEDAEEMAEVEAPAEEPQEEMAATPAAEQEKEEVEEPAVAEKAEPKKEMAAPPAEQAKVELKSAKDYKQGFRVTNQPCKVYEKAQPDAKVLNTVAGEKKLWTEPHSQQYLKVYTKRGPAFVAPDCFGE